MQTKTQQEFRQLLLQLKSDIENEKSDYGELETEKMADHLDAASVNISQELKTQFLRRRSMYLKKIGEALAKLNDGTYGECDWCGEEITEKRLRVRPTATLCISCKEEQEREEREKRQTGGGILSAWEPEGEF